MRIEIPDRVAKRFIAMVRAQGKCVVYRRLPLKKDLLVIHTQTSEALKAPVVTP